MASSSRSRYAPYRRLQLQLPAKEEEESQIAFFDVEASFPTGKDQRRELLEIAIVVICPSTLIEVTSYTTLVRPANPASARNQAGLTWHDLSRAPCFRQVAGHVYSLLEGRVWAGHNIAAFDCKVIKDAFNEIGGRPPQPRRIVDTLTLIYEKFGRSRGGSMKLAELAKSFGLGKQTHRSLDDVRMNIAVLGKCATVVLLEESAREGTTVPISSGYYGFLEPDDVGIECIEINTRSLGFGSRTSIEHRGRPLQLYCAGLELPYVISKKYFPKINIAVKIPDDLKRVLEFCDNLAMKLLQKSPGHYTWNKLIKPYVPPNPPIARLNIPIIAIANTNAPTYRTSIDIFLSGDNRKLVFNHVSSSNDAIDSVFCGGSKVDAFFSVHAYKFNDLAGIRLVARRLVVHSN